MVEAVAVEAAAGSVDAAMIQAKLPVFGNFECAELCLIIVR